ncbi:MAG: archaeal proteasome endopeptidase complex subunit beta [Candidatus Hadarchaeum sp.]|uniref:archaeal proteasome endopeptidase complex subunit beta n=1 Tax=Candidatus Hadarchaeum sp. TaxID=2883567 RepID=UPI003D0E7D2D
MKEERFEQLKGTTTVGMVCKDGVVLATDSRATMGYLVASKKSRKIYSITDRIAFTTAGGVADTEQLVNMMRAEAGYYAMHEGIPMNVLACAKMVSNLMNSYIYYANLLVGGMDGDIPRLFFIDVDGGMIEEKMVATGSGSPVAYGVLETEFKEGMKTDEAVPVAIRAVKTAMKRDIATGNEVQVAVITKKGYRELTPDEIKKLA